MLETKVEPGPDVISDSELATVAQHIPRSHCKQLAFGLGITQDSIQGLEGKYKRSSDYCTEILKQWRETSTTLHSPRNTLIYVLDSLGHTALAEFLRTV